MSASMRHALGMIGRLEKTAKILPGCAALAQWPVQLTIGLQSAPGMADPSIDYPVGSVHLYQLAEPGDDARASIEAFCQPVLIITSGQG